MSVSVGEFDFNVGWCRRRVGDGLGGQHHRWRRELLEGWAEDALLNGMRECAASKGKWLVGPRSLRRF